MPRQSASGPLPTPPSRGDPDRKRVLNILAQRRYRQRKRERIAALEATANPKHNGGTNTLPSPLESPPSLDLGVNHSLSPPESTICPQYLFEDPRLIPDSASPDLSSMVHLNRYGNQITTSPHFDFNPDASALDFSLLADDDDNPFSLPSTEISAQDTQNFQTTSHCNTSTSSFPLTSDAKIELPMLKMMRIIMTIAGELDCITTILDPLYTRTLSLDTFPRHLPPNLHPTPAQLTIPHHPLFDILPFPSMRSKLIVMFSLPSHLRPPQAQDDMAILNFAMDCDDETEGMRVNGGGISLREDEWEIGLKVFSKWWWCCDQDIIKQSNRFRLERGAEKLRIVEEVLDVSNVPAACSQYDFNACTRVLA